MPEKGLTVATYAAGASLATIALIYVFAPTYLLDNAPAGSSNPLSAMSNRKNGVVGLFNAANDCFINSVLQTLAGLGDLRIYLIRETHRRKIDKSEVYADAVPEDAVLLSAGGIGTSRRSTPTWKIEGLQAGLVTKGLKDMIDQLNERPIAKKTISAAPFVRVLEAAFHQRISRQQQDAQEFLQIVAERLCDEYHAGQRARRFARRKAAIEVDAAMMEQKLASIAAASTDGAADLQQQQQALPSKSSNGKIHSEDEDEDEEGFPMEGKIESQIECLTCGFKPRPSEQTFCTLTLNVPQVSSTSLGTCFDSMLKTEYIDDFKCEKCRLVHAKQALEAELAKSTSESFQKETEKAIAELQEAIDTDPERPPLDVMLPDSRYAPKRRIARHFRVVSFPKILAIHLSRSIYDITSQKNSAKVAFPERLPLGSLLQQRRYKLLGLVTHKGSHHSGHYESFRRQTVAEPFSNPNTFAVSTAFTPSASPTATTPKIDSPDLALIRQVNGSVPSVANLPPAASNSEKPLPPTSAPREEQTDSPTTEAAAETSSLRSITRSTLSKLTPSSRSGSRSGSRHGSRHGSRTVSRAGSVKHASPLHPMAQDGNGSAVENDKKAAAEAEAARPRRRKRPNDRWWRISDEKVRESSTREVLGMQREVYLLFYELERSSYGLARG